MKKLNVIVKDKNTLILQEAGNPGDYIDLSDLTSIDTASLEKCINDGSDKLYQQKLASLKKELDLGFINKEQAIKNEYQKTISELQNKINSFEKDKNNLIASKDAEYKLKASARENEYSKNIDKINFDNQNIINDLKNQIQTLKYNHDNDIKIAEMKLNETYLKQISALNEKLNKTISDNELAKKENEIKNNNEIAELRKTYEAKILEKDQAFLALQRQKATLNVKQTGEDLESWCNNEMKSYRQTGLFNTTWIKDNDVIREEGESKGSKADYIFKIYATDEHNADEELASVCLDMKDENPDSVNKQTNEHYYKDLDKNRNKKNCKYAVLVSNLETDKPNDLPIWKVEEYPDMYVVRPAYMMSFLSMINSLTMKFKELLLEGKKERLEVMAYIDLENKLNDLKKTYLDNPLNQLATHIEKIRTQSDTLRKTAATIDTECDFIIRNYINEIQNKLSKLDDEVGKAYRKFDRETR